MKKILTIITLSLALSACGGGGGSETPVKAFSASIASKPATLDEGQEGTVTVTVNNAINTLSSELIIVSGTTGADAVVVNKVNNTSFTIKAADVDRKRDVSLKLTVKDGTDPQRQYTTTFSVTVNNTSFAPTLAEIEVASAQKDRLVNLNEEKVFLGSLRDIATVLGEDPAKIAADIAAGSGVTGSSEALSMAIDTLNQGMADYASGTVGEATLKDQYNQFKTTLSEYSNTTKTELNALLAVLSKDGKQPVQLTEYMINADLSSISLVVGNPDLGDVTDGVWTYKPEFDYLNALMTNADCAN